MKLPTGPVPVWERVVLATAGITAIVLAVLGVWVGAVLVGLGPLIVATFEGLRFVLRRLVRRAESR
jgi:hypothetical protein